MTTATLSHIGTPSEPWGDNNLVFIDLAFTDHEPATLTTNEQGKASRLADLNALLNKPAEWDFGTNSKGKPTVKIHKADGFGGGGKKGGWQPKSAEERAEHLAMSAMKAVAHLAAAEMSALGPESVPEAARKKSLEFVKVAMRELVGTATSLLKASGTEGPSVTGKGATASSVPADSVEVVGSLTGGSTGDEIAGSVPSHQEPRDRSTSTTTSGASDPLDVTPDRDGDGATNRTVEAEESRGASTPGATSTTGAATASNEQPEQGGAVSSRHVHEWVTKNPKGGDLIPGWVRCLHCPISRRANDPEVVGA